MSFREEFVIRLRQQVQLEIQSSWRTGAISRLDQLNLSDFEPISVNDQNYLLFPQGGKVVWLAQKIIVPPALQNYPVSGLSLRLVLTWWAEDAQIFINGRLVQQGDLFDSSARVLVTEDAQIGQEYLVAIRLLTPHHDVGALMRSHLLYEKSDLPHSVDPGLVADEITVLSNYLSRFAPEDLEVLTQELNNFSWQNLPHADRFTADLSQLRSRLIPLGKNLQQRCFYLLGHAHLDMAWLWTTTETKEVAQRTFNSVLSLQQNYPALIFGHTSPALYQWIEIDYPELFEAIQHQVRLNRWELLGGMWIEPETNLVSGESLIRQLIYGQQYYQEKFGKMSQVAWLPDSFGFTWQLPQIFKLCGIEYFVTGKLHWNDTTKFPHGCFWWEAPDGTRLLTLMSPPNVTGVMDTNPITMTNYALDWEEQTGLQDIFWLPGVGDHGGGPTEDMLAVAAQWNDSPLFPEIKFSRAIDYLETIAASHQEFPVWQDELYLELHRGCYTVRGEQKKFNRYSERLLYEAELWASCATLLCEDRFVGQTLFANINSIPQKTPLNLEGWQQLIATAWQKVLFNQFHDILPGTSIPEVFIEANQDWQEAIKIGENLLQAALEAIALSIQLPPAPQTNAQAIIVFNSLNWERSQAVTIKTAILANNHFKFWIVNQAGQKIDSSSKQSSHQLTFLANQIPSVGYGLYWLCWAVQETTPEQQEPEPNPDKWELQNQYLQVIINQETGDIDSIVDLVSDRQILTAPGNQLQAFIDQGQYWDAWNIDPQYQQKPLPHTQLRSITWIDGELSQGIRVVRKFNQSTFTQDYILVTDAPLLKIATQVDWQETHVMVKATFPLNLSSDYVTYEIPCGTINRTTKPQTAAEQAKWEVSALNWVDLTDDRQNYGVSLLNDGKYGYDAQPNQLRITLLRSPRWPDPQSDHGRHHFTYALYPHQDHWQPAQTVHQGYQLNTPLKTIILEPNHSSEGGETFLPASSSLLKIAPDNLILMALKLTNQRKIIMRCYEAYGQPGNLTISGELNLQPINRVDCLENRQTGENNQTISPYQIINWQLQNPRK